MSFLNKASDLRSHISTHSKGRQSGVHTVTGSGEHRIANSGEHAVAGAAPARTTDLPPLTFDSQAEDLPKPERKSSIFGL